MITRRRALAAAGAGVLVAGCGAPAEPPSDAALLRRSIGAEQDLADAYQRLGGKLGNALSAQSRRNVELLQGLLGGSAPSSPTRLSAQPVGGRPESRAVDAAQRALRVHLHTVGFMRTGRHRATVADVITTVAQQSAVLAGRVGTDPLASSFPDGTQA